MRSVVELDIDAPQESVAALYSDPLQNANWMDDVERIEPISGQPGMPGSKYRLVPKKGDMVFVATVLARDLPSECLLRLEASNVTVGVHATFGALPSNGTKLICAEVFRFDGMVDKVLGLFAGRAIKAAHRRHMEAFKRYAESRR